MLEQVSLEALIGIANHKTLSPYLSQVIIGLDTFPHNAGGAGLAVGHLERQVLLETGRAMEMLVEAFSKLKNLRVLGLRDYESGGRTREGENARWRSYGWSSGSTDAERAQIRYGQPTLGECPKRSILALLFGALDRAGSKPEAFEAFLRRQRLPLASFDALSCISNATSTLASLKRLMLNVEPSQQPILNNRDTAYNGMVECLRQASALQHLRINFSHESADPDQFLQWLGSPSGSSPSLSPPAQFCHLQSLDLGMLHARPQVIIDVVCKFNLQTLSFYRMALMCNDLAEFDEDPGVWGKFLFNLGKSLPKSTELRTISVSHATQMVLQVFNLVRVHFAESVKIDENGVKKYEGASGGVIFRKQYGSDVRQWLRDLASKTCVRRPDPPVVEDDGEESDEEEDAVSHDGSDEEGGEEDQMAAEVDGEEETDAQ